MHGFTCTKYVRDFQEKRPWLLNAGFTLSKLPRNLTIVLLYAQHFKLKVTKSPVTELYTVVLAVDQNPCFLIGGMHTALECKCTTLKITCFSELAYT